MRIVEWRRCCLSTGLNVRCCCAPTDQQTKRETGRKAQLGNIQAAKVCFWLCLLTAPAVSPPDTPCCGALLVCLLSVVQAVSEIIRTTLGPRSMLKMLLDPMGGIVITNDGNAILREIDVSHPAAKSMIELSRSQDEEVGDGTTSVIILCTLRCVVACGPCVLCLGLDWRVRGHAPSRFFFTS